MKVHNALSQNQVNAYIPSKQLLPFNLWSENKIIFHGYLGDKSFWFRNVHTTFSAVQSQKAVSKQAVTSFWFCITSVQS